MELSFRRRPLVVVMAIVAATATVLVLSCRKEQHANEGAANPSAAQADLPPLPESSAAATIPPFDEASVLPSLSCGSLDGAKRDADGSLFLWGWAYDARRGEPAPEVIVVDRGRRVGSPLPVSLERPDVVATKGSSKLLRSGWNLRLPPGSAAAGEPVFEALALLADGKLCRLGGKLGAPAPSAP